MSITMTSLSLCSIYDGNSSILPSFSPSESCPQNPGPPSKLDAVTEDEPAPAFFTLFSGQDIIHQIPVVTPYQGAVAVPAAGTGGGAAAIS